MKTAKLYEVSFGHLGIHVLNIVILEIYEKNTLNRLSNICDDFDTVSHLELR